MFKNLIGKKFMPGGRGPFFYDCYGVCREVHQRYGINIPEVNVSEYKAKVVSKQIIEEADSPRWERIEKPEVPCGVVFRFGHIGVYIGNNRFIHIMEDRPVWIDKLTDPVWEKMFIGFYRYVPGT